MAKLKSWVGHALDLLERSLSPLPVEPNELDWESGLTTRLLGLIERPRARSRCEPAGPEVAVFSGEPALNAGASVREAE